jgi:hypothetical protein
MRYKSLNLLSQAFANSARIIRKLLQFANFLFDLTQILMRYKSLNLMSQALMNSREKCYNGANSHENYT